MRRLIPLKFMAAVSCPKASYIHFVRCEIDDETWVFQTRRRRSGPFFKLTPFDIRRTGRLPLDGHDVTRANEVLRKPLELAIAEHERSTPNGVRFKPHQAGQQSGLHSFAGSPGHELRSDPPDESTGTPGSWTSSNIHDGIGSLVGSSASASRRSSFLSRVCSCLRTGYAPGFGAS